VFSVVKGRWDGESGRRWEDVRVRGCEDGSGRRWEEKEM
jgi:hypothetical protein